VTSAREPAFETLVDCVQSCRKCARMNNVQRVLGWGNGALNPRVMFIGEAPGRLGAEQTGLPFHGDVAGHNFEKLLSSSGLSRNEVFITNSVLCNPQKDDGTNDTPARHEIENCAEHLEAQIRLVDPKIVAPLGAKALYALNLIEEHNLELATSIRTARLWFGRALVPLYHPGQRAMIHRSFANQQADYYFLASLLRPARAPTRGKMKPEALHLVRWVLRHRSSTSLFALHKMLFLAEIASIRTTGARSTNLYFIRQKDGPYCTDLASIAKRKNSGIEIYSDGGRPFVRERNESDLFSESPKVSVDAAFAEILGEILEECGDLSDAQLKQRAYQSIPMRRILRLERNGRSCLNRPLLTDDDVFAVSEKFAA
jgi:uracil-DNA glycosylase family 4